MFLYYRGVNPNVAVNGNVKFVNISERRSKRVKGPQISAVHFHNIFDVTMTMSLGAASDLLAANVISKKKVIASSMPRMAGWQVELELIFRGK